MAKSTNTTSKNKDTEAQSSTGAASGSQASTDKNNKDQQQTKEDKAKKFEGDGVVFKAKLIGLELVPESRGDKMCQSSIQKLKAIIKGTNCHKRRITLKISYEGIKVFDEKTGEIIHHHKVPEISYIASDDQDSRAFGYVFGMPSKTHQFICFKTSGPAVGVMACISELFEAVLDKKNKEKDDKAKLERQQQQQQITNKTTNNKDDSNILLTNDHSIFNGDCSSNSIGTNSSSGIGSSTGSVSIASGRQNSIDHLSSLLFGSSPSSSPSTWGTSSLANQVNKHQQAPFNVPRQPQVERLRESGHCPIPLLPSPPSKHRQIAGGDSLIRSSSPLFSLDALGPPIPEDTTTSTSTTNATTSTTTTTNSSANQNINLSGGHIGSRHSDRNKSSASVFSLASSPRPAPAPVSSSLQNDSFFANAFGSSTTNASAGGGQPTFTTTSSAAPPRNNSSGLLRQLSVTSTDSTDRYAAFNEFQNLPSVFESALQQQQQQEQQQHHLTTSATANKNEEVTKFQLDDLFRPENNPSPSQLVPAFDAFGIGFDSETQQHQQAPFHAARQPQVERLREIGPSPMTLLTSPPSKHRQTAVSDNPIRSSSPLFSLDAIGPPIPEDATTSTNTTTSANQNMNSFGGNIGSRHSDRNQSSASVFSLASNSPVRVSSSLQNDSFFANAFGSSTTNSSAGGGQPTFTTTSSAAPPRNNSSGLLRQLSVTSTDSADRYAAFNEFQNHPSFFESAVQQQQHSQQPQHQQHQQQQLHHNQSNSNLFNYMTNNNNNNTGSNRDIFKRTNPFADDFFD